MSLVVKGLIKECQQCNQHTFFHYKLLTTAAMVDNLAIKVDKCPLNRGR